MPSDLPDIEEKVKVWAWNMFLKTRSKEYSKLKYEDVALTVNWSKVKFISSTPEYFDERKLDTPNSQVVFRSKYENWTNHEQEHSFQTERTTTSYSSTTISKGFTKGFHLEVKLGLPDEVAGATAGFGRDITMETTEEDCHEKSMTWSINSNIKVPPKHRTIAELVVKEQEFTAAFKMSVQVKGIVHVVVTSLKENNCFVQALEGDFAEVMSRDATSDGIRINNRTVTFEMEGKCQFRYGVEQHVQLFEETL